MELDNDRTDVRGRRLALTAGTAAIALTLLAGACGSDDGSTAESPTIDPSPPTTVNAPTTSAPPENVEIVEVHEDFGYYGACGNEPVKVDGAPFYPLLPEDRKQLPKADYPLPGSTPESAPGTTPRSTTPSSPGSSGTTADAAGFGRVAPPGPGDDIGTMVVYADGIARFESKSGRVIWLTDQKQTYDWVC